MSYGFHVATKYDVEWSSTCHNMDKYDVVCFLNDNIDNCICFEDDPIEIWASDLETVVKKYENDEEYERYISMFKHWLRHVNKDGYVVVSWF